MVLYLNYKGVIIDIVEEAMPVKLNRNGLIVPCVNGPCQGYMASDKETVYAKVGTNLQPTFYDVALLQTVDSVPSNVKPLQYLYVDGDFVMNQEGYPDTNKGLTNRASDLEDMILEMSEIIYA